MMYVKTLDVKRDKTHSLEDGRSSPSHLGALTQALLPVRWLLPPTPVPTSSFLTWAAFPNISAFGSYFKETLFYEGLP